MTSNMGVGRGAFAPPPNLEFSARKDFLCFEWEKSNFTTVAPALGNFWKNPLVSSLGKNPSDTHDFKQFTM